MRVLASGYAAAVLFLAGCAPQSASTDPNIGPLMRTVAISVTGPGSVSGTGVTACRGQCPAQVLDGAEVKLAAQPDPGAVFTGWSQACSGTGLCDLVVHADLQIIATFAAPPPAGKHNFFVSRSGSGTVLSTPVGIDCGSTCVAPFTDGTTVSLSATPDAGFRFSGWGGACSGSGECAVAVSASSSVTAVFEAIPPPPGRRTLAVTRSGNGRVASSPAGIDCGAACTAQYDKGTSVTLTATPDAGWTFSGWTGGCTGTAACTVSLSSDLSVGATFAAAPPPDDCAGLMPASVPAPRLLGLVTSNATERCQPGHADGQGNLALGVLDTRTPGDRYFRTYLDDPSGRLLGFFTANDLDLYEEASGFLSVNRAGTAGKVDRLSLAGQIEREAQMSPTPYKVSAEDPTGGAVVITFANQSLLMHGVESFDAQPVARWHYFPTENLYYVTHGVDRVGNTLLVYRTQADDALYGQWFSPADARGARFVFSGAHDYGNNQLQLVPRVGSGFFLQALTAPRAGFTFAGAAWVGQIDTGAQAVQPPPAWLRSWDNRKMHPAREGSAYAFIDLPGGTADCTQNIAVVSASGKTCGSTAFQAGLNPGACTTASIDVAWDGTVIQQRPDAQEQHDPSGTQSCTWSYWTGLLK